VRHSLWYADNGGFGEDVLFPLFTKLNRDLSAKIEDVAGIDPREDENLIVRVRNRPFQWVADGRPFKESIREIPRIPFPVLALGPKPGLTVEPVRSLFDNEGFD
jgi:hypothetical protein